MLAVNYLRKCHLKIMLKTFKDSFHVWCRLVRLKHSWTYNIKQHKLSNKQSPVVQNKMRTLNRAWSYHPDVLHQLRKDILLNPKFIDTIVFSPKVKLFQNPEEKNYFAPGFDDVRNISSAELEASLKQLLNLPKHKQIKYGKILEKECCARFWTWDMIRTLRVLDMFCLSEYRAPMLLNSVLHMVYLNSKTLITSPKYLLQLLFYISMIRNCPITLMRKIEDLVISQQDEYSANELGFICHAFFVTNTSFQRYDLLKLISERTLNALNTKTFLPYMIQNVCKAFRHAAYEDDKFYQELGDLLLQIKGIGVVQMLGVFKVFVFSGFIHSAFIQNVTAHAESALRRDKHAFSFKVLTSLVWGCHHLQQECPKLIVDHLLHVVEEEFKFLSKEYPERYVESLMALSLAGRYPERAISYALSSIYFESQKDSHLEQYFQLLVLHEAQNFTGKSQWRPTLSEKLLTNVPGGYLCDVEKQLEVRQGLRVVVSVLQNLLQDSRCVKLHNIVRFTKIPDIEMHFSKNKKALVFDPFNMKIVSKPQKSRATSKQPISVIDSLTHGQGVAGLNRVIPPNLYLTPSQNSDREVIRVVVKVLSWHQYAVNSPTLLGIHKYELDILQNMGYHIITINPFHAAQLDNMTTEEQEDFIQKSVLSKILN